MSIRSTTTVLAALAAFGLCGVAQTAAAQTRVVDPDAVSIKVSYTDLNLSNPAGAKTLLHRIHEAATDICGEPDRDLAALIQNQACMKATIDRAVASLNDPMVTALNSGQPVPTHPGVALAFRDH